MSTLVNKLSTNREGGVQNFGKLVYVDCERPLILHNNVMGVVKFSLAAFKTSKI